MWLLIVECSQLDQAVNGLEILVGSGAEVTVCTKDFATHFGLNRIESMYELKFGKWSGGEALRQQECTPCAGRQQRLDAEGNH